MAPINTALASLTPLNGDVIKSQTAFAQYVAGFGWLGNLTYLEAPKGYLIKLAQPGVLTYPGNNLLDPNGSANRVTTGGSGTKATSRSPMWTVDATQFEQTMTLVGIISAEGINGTLENHEIGAFAGGELRGGATALYIEPLHAYMFFLTLYANQAGELLTFKLNDGTNISDVNETMYFSNDAQVGSVDTPYPFTSGVSATADVEDTEPMLSVMPNPAQDYTTIRFTSKEVQTVVFSLSDAAGRLIQIFDYEAVRGMNAMLWEAVGKLPQGVYLLKMEAGGNVMTEKVVKR